MNDFSINLKNKKAIDFFSQTNLITSILKLQKEKEILFKAKKKFWISEKKTFENGKIIR